MEASFPLSRNGVRQESGVPCMTQVCLDPFGNSGCSSYEGRYKVDLLYGAHWQLTSADPLQSSG
jgi:hypothetical protein